MRNVKKHGNEVIGTKRKRTAETIPVNAIRVGAITEKNKKEREDVRDLRTTSYQ